mgnify:CR=1 FL=1
MLSDVTYIYHYVCICILTLASKELANFCKQFSHFEILKMTRPLKLNSRLKGFLNYFLKFESLLNYALNSEKSEKFCFLNYSENFL